ncbi:hypothetical protein GUJ93_ZPchr0001g30634 [Zizania palustris]|uniref:Uncharacterized protein n=1 Tax=Zizania palustris TaxID=103762 RepID=A0A8J5VTE7_ZIZPA|nr:hypothetical protein GUJ93_ZPchr0001g30634 [Zizania palustris]
MTGRQLEFWYETQLPSPWGKTSRTPPEGLTPGARAAVGCQGLAPPQGFTSEGLTPQGLAPSASVGSSCRRRSSPPEGLARGSPPEGLAGGSPLEGLVGAAPRRKGSCRGLAPGARATTGACRRRGSRGGRRLRASRGLRHAGGARGGRATSEGLLPRARAGSSCRRRGLPPEGLAGGRRLRASRGLCHAGGARRRGSRRAVEGPRARAAQIARECLIPIGLLVLIEGWIRLEAQVLCVEEVKIKGFGLVMKMTSLSSHYMRYL